VARRFQSRRSFRSGSAPNRGWAGSSPGAVVSVAANTKVLLATVVLDNDGIDETLLRTIGVVSIQTDNVAADENQIGAIGMCLVTDTVAGIGVASMPDPVTDVADDIWIVHLHFAQGFNVQDATGANSNFMNSVRFDQHAKRIMHSGQSMAVIGANASAAFGFDMLFQFRQLWMVRGTR